MKRMFQLASIAASAVFFTGCIATFDQTALDNGKAGKTATLAVMDKATAPYAGHAAEVTSLRTQLNGYLQYEKGRANNDASVQLWGVILRDNGALNRFVRLWETGPRSKAYIGDKKKHIETQFDILAELENAKPKK